FPPGYFIEPVVGALYAAPFLVAALFALFGRRDDSAARGRALMVAVLYVSSASTLLFLAATGFTTHRYEADFLPLAVLAALATCGTAIARSAGLRRALFTVALIMLIFCSAIVNLALGLNGPYDELRKKQPRIFVRLARWFSPVAEYQPVLNPDLEVTF